ncbi:MAG: LEPR-XLL domain-containing protein, partial [Desulfuromonadales bacterium]|nr:LEPR-XLL domain-containing protein [Desulfuromonadales bacterium]
MMRRLRRTRDKTKQRPVRRKMKFEALEPRILLSADLGIEQLVPHIDPLLASAPVVGEVLSEESSASQGVDTPPDLSSNFAEVQKKELVIVDSSV